MKRLLFCTSWYSSNINRWLSEAFVDAGYEVIRVGPTNFKHYGIEWNNTPIITEEFNEHAPLNLPRLVDTYKPDILLMWDWTGEPPTYQVEDEDLTRKLKERLPFIYVQHEGWENALKRKDIFNPSLCYTGMPYGVRSSPCNATAMGYKYLPGACYPQVHRKINSFSQRDLECVLFAGMYYPRPEICKELESMGVKIKWGNVPVSEYESQMNRSLTTWEFSGGTDYIKWRIFEAMSMGTIVLTDRFNLLDKLGFKPNVHYLEYTPVYGKNDEFIPEALDLFLMIQEAKEAEKYNSISEKAYELVRAKHTYAHRVSMIEGDLSCL
jgi:hypothetical protein